ncbi:MAG TPA: hypothetical protein VF194_10710 [Ferrovibrio sp.]|uniref:hypothetical protein n=1 Tax=Ferrovibrio sp. TaxID=1917215 RepID=UPI002ED0DD4C
MANRAGRLIGGEAPRALLKARADLSRAAASAPAASAADDEAAAGQSTEEAAAQAAPASVDPAGFPARLDLMRARLAEARVNAVSALLFLGDAQQDCDALAEICQSLDWPLTKRGVELLSDALRRAIPSDLHHLDLIRLLIDALYALRRAEAQADNGQADMAQAGTELLQGLAAAIRRELGDGAA